MVVSSFFGIFAPNPPFYIRGSFTDSCGISNGVTFVCMKVDSNSFTPCPNDETNALIEIDGNGFTWVYKGKENGYDSWYGIPPESL